MTAFDVGSGMTAFYGAEESVESGVENVEKERDRQADADADRRARKKRRRDEYGHRTGKKQKEKAKSEELADAAAAEASGLPWWVIPAALGLGLLLVLR